MKTKPKQLLYHQISKRNIWILSVAPDIPFGQICAWNFWPGSICASNISVNIILLVTVVGVGQSPGTQWDTKVCKADTGREQEWIFFFLLCDSTGNSAKIVSLILNRARKSKYKKAAFWLERRINVVRGYWAVSQRYEWLTHVSTEVWKILHLQSFYTVLWWPAVNIIGLFFFNLFLSALNLYF